MRTEPGLAEAINGKQHDSVRIRARGRAQRGDRKLRFRGERTREDLGSQASRDASWTVRLEVWIDSSTERGLRYCCGPRTKHSDEKEENQIRSRRILLRYPHASLCIRRRIVYSILEFVLEVVSFPLLGLAMFLPRKKKHRVSSKAIIFIGVRCSTCPAKETHWLVARLVINMDESAVDLRKFLEFVLQRLRAVERKRLSDQYFVPGRPGVARCCKPRALQARKQTLEGGNTHTSCATKRVVSPFMTRSTSITYRGPLWYTMQESIASIWSANVIAL